MRIMSPPGPDGNAVPPDRLQAKADPRLQAFTDFLASIDNRDWRAGQLATRRLRSLGISACLCKPNGGGGAA